MRKSITDRENLLKNLKNCDSLTDFLSKTKKRESEILDLLLNDKDFKSRYFEILILKTELTAFDLALKGNNPMLQFLLINHKPDTYKKTGQNERELNPQSRILYLDAEQDNGIQKREIRESKRETPNMEKET